MNKNRERQRGDASQIIQYGVEGIKHTEEGDAEREYNRFGIDYKRI